MTVGIRDADFGLRWPAEVEAAAAQDAPDGDGPHGVRFFTFHAASWAHTRPGHHS